MTEEANLDLPADRGQEPAGDKLNDIVSASLDKVFGDEPQTDAPARVRDEHGKFSRADKASSAAQAGQEPAAATQTPATPSQAQPAAPTALEAPARWSDAEKAEFAALPAAAQKVVSDRYKAMEADYTRKTQEIAAFRNSAEPLLQTVKPFEGYLRQIGQHPHQAIGALLQTEHQLRTGTPQQKLQTFARIAADYGVNLAALTGGQAGQPDPLVSQLHQHTVSADQRLRAIEQFAQQEQQRRHAASVSQTNAEIDAFAVAKDDQGRPKHPHFDRVSGYLPSIIHEARQRGESIDLARAYQIAAQPILDAIAAEVGQRQAPAPGSAQALDRARRAAPVRSSGTAPRGTAAVKGLDAIVSQALDRAGIV